MVAATEAIEKRPVGRPAIDITDEIISKVESLSGCGATLSTIALMCDVSDSTMDRWMAEPRIKRAFQRGRAIANNQVASMLFGKAVDGDVVAQIFWLKAQAGWTDKPQPEVSTGSQVVFYIPENGRGANAA